MRFLVAKPEADYTTASMASAAVMILLYCNTLYQQFGGISKAEDGPFIYNGSGLSAFSHRQRRAEPCIPDPVLTLKHPPCQRKGRGLDKEENEHPLIEMD